MNAERRSTRRSGASNHDGSVGGEASGERRRPYVRLDALAPAQAKPVVGALIDAGITEIDLGGEVPRAMNTLRVLVECHDSTATLGVAVRTVARIGDAAEVGARAVTLPSSDPALIRAGVRRRLVVRACAFTTTECLQAFDAGADALVLYPARVLGPDGVQAIREMLPCGTARYAGGGIGVGNLATWVNAGIDRFHVGPSLYRPGVPLERVATAAEELVRAYDHRCRSRTGRPSWRCRPNMTVDTSHTRL